MEFLKGVGFDAEEIQKLNNSIPDLIFNLLLDQEKLVITNIDYLKNLGITNYKNIFLKFYEVFLLDHSTFKAMLDKYETPDLIKFLEKDLNIFEYL